jgi:hypothetical protein
VNWQDALAIAVFSFWWGEWWGARNARKTAERDGAAFKLLYSMVSGILEKRKLVGGYLTIIRSETFDVMGERFTLTLESQGDPKAAIDLEPIK